MSSHPNVPSTYSKQSTNQNVYFYKVTFILHFLKVPLKSNFTQLFNSIHTSHDIYQAHQSEKYVASCVQKIIYAKCCCLPFLRAAVIHFADFFKRSLDCYDSLKIRFWKFNLIVFWRIVILNPHAYYYHVPTILYQYMF